MGCPGRREDPDEKFGVRVLPTKLKRRSSEAIDRRAATGGRTHEVGFGAAPG